MVEVLLVSVILNGLLTALWLYEAAKVRKATAEMLNNLAIIVKAPSVSEAVQAIGYVSQVSKQQKPVAVELDGREYEVL